jgi:hypothetical protein
MKIPELPDAEAFFTCLNWFYFAKRIDDDELEMLNGGRLIFFNLLSVP